MSINDELQQFLHTTESNTSGISTASQTKTIQYPFVFIKGITNVELSYLADHKYLSRSKTSEDSLPLYLKANKSYKLLGYIELTFGTIVHLSYLTTRELYIKPDKDHTGCVTSELLSSLLLTKG